MSRHCFEPVDVTFPERAKAAGGGFIVGGENYGQGSSREHAALVPMYLGIKAVLVRSFARIHRANLINFGILPLTFVDPADYERINRSDILEILGVTAALEAGEVLLVKNITQQFEFQVKAELTTRQKAILKAGGMLNFTREQALR